MSASRNKEILKELSSVTGDRKRELLEELLISNEGLIHMALRGYTFQTPSFSYDDALQEGRMALMKAAANYDGRGEFSTYALAVIKKRLKRACWDTNHIHVPEYLRQKLNGKIRQAEESGIPLTDLIRGDDRLISAFNALSPPVYLSSPVGGDTDLSVEDLVGLSDSVLESSEARADLEQALKRVSKEERDMLYVYSGILPHGKIDYRKVKELCDALRKEVTAV